MGLFAWISDKATAIYNYIIDCIYPNNIIPYAQPAPIPIVEESLVQGPASTNIVEESSGNAQLLHFTITDENEPEIYASLEQNAAAINVTLVYDKEEITSAHGNLVSPDPLRDLNSGLAMVMIHHAGIRHLGLNGAGIDTAGLLTLADILSRDGNRLESLDLANNNRAGSKGHRDAGLRALFRALGGHRTLKSIDLRRTNISDDMAPWIAACLENNSSLEKVDLSYNSLYARGIRAIVRTIEISPVSVVTHISLSYNNVYDYNVGVDPNPDEGIHQGRLHAFPLGDQNTVYRFINEISATRDRINADRAVLREFLGFAACTMINSQGNQCRKLHDDIVSKVGEMLFSGPLLFSVSPRRATIGEQGDAKQIEPLVLDCPAHSRWKGPSIS